MAKRKAVKEYISFRNDPHPRHSPLTWIASQKRTLGPASASTGRKGISGQQPVRPASVAKRGADSVSTHLGRTGPEPARLTTRSVARPVTTSSEPGFLASVSFRKKGRLLYASPGKRAKNHHGDDEQEHDYRYDDADSRVGRNHRNRISTCFGSSFIVVVIHQVTPLNKNITQKKSAATLR